VPKSDEYFRHKLPDFHALLPDFNLVCTEQLILSATEEGPILLMHLRRETAIARESEIFILDVCPTERRINYASNCEMHAHATHQARS
jgi:hypothetical protein